MGWGCQIGRGTVTGRMRPGRRRGPTSIGAPCSTIGALGRPMGGGGISGRGESSDAGASGTTGRDVGPVQAGDVIGGFSGRSDSSGSARRDAVIPGISGPGRA
jgi:hypothetical protein